MTLNTISVEDKGAIRIISLNRPDRLNAWTEDMALEIRSSMEKFFATIPVNMHG